MLWQATQWERKGGRRKGLFFDQMTDEREVLIDSIRVSYETSFDSKQPKLESKLVSALSETKCLFRLFHFHTETESFDVSIEPKQT